MPHPAPSPSSPAGRALLRPPPASYARALSRDPDPRSVDHALALRQHAEYAAALAAVGLAVTCLDPDPDLPDSCFVQDPAFVVDGLLVVGRMGEASRRAEAAALLAALAPAGLPVAQLPPPGRLEGGDVMLTEDRLFVGLRAAGRSDRAGAAWLGEALARAGSPRRVTPVPVPERYLHLLSGCSYLGQGRLLAAAGCASPPEFEGLEVLPVPEGEEPAANVLVRGAHATRRVPAGYPRTADLLAGAGFTLHPVPISEFEKRDGGVTCLTLLY